MNYQKAFTHSVAKTDYNVKLKISENQLRIHLQQKLSIDNWQGTFQPQYIQQITSKTGHKLTFEKFTLILINSFEKRDEHCYADILSSQDLQNLRAKKGEKKQKTSQNKSNKRYIILTYMSNDTRVHYPLPLNVFQSENDPQKLKQLYKQLRQELDNQKMKSFNETSKSDQSGSFSINYEKKGNKNNLSGTGTHLKQIDQLKSQNQILKNKLKRLQEQAQKKGGSQLDAIIERKNQLQKALQTPNMKLVDIKYAVEEQQQTYVSLKQQLLQLHKEISNLLITQKEIKIKKHGQQVQKQLVQVKNNILKNTNEVERLKQQLQKAKLKNKELEMKAKKINAQKDVIKRGRKGPYSSYSGSVKSNSIKGSINGSVSSKRSNLSYNSYKFR